MPTLQMLFHKIFKESSGKFFLISHILSKNCKYWNFTNPSAGKYYKKAFVWCGNMDLYQIWWAFIDK